ncbi:MAG: peptide deformylase [Streptococcaceae bacterium]|jgi:peptide deformylase|nr:peptide deformylase [Streptococcaceae bacterium]
MREIVLVPNEILTTPTVSVLHLTDDILELIQEMKDLMVEHDGVGIAAPQVGSNLRIGIVQIDPEDDFLVMINPKIKQINGKDIFVEGCLSVPGVFGTVERAESILLTFTNEEGDQYEMEADGYLARAIQHEIDHLDGVLFTDKIIDRIQEEDLEAYYEEYERGLQDE